MSASVTLRSPSVLIIDILNSAISQLKLNIHDGCKVENPSNASFGDFATSIALSIFSANRSDSTFISLYPNPRSLADALAEEVRNQVSKSGKTIFSNIEVAGAGFINFTLHHNYLLEFSQQLVINQAKLPKPSKTAGSAIIEYLGPNTNKPLHIGHLRNGALGLAVGNLLTETGWQVHFATINNDRGLHIMKSVWGYLELARKTDDAEVKPWQSLLQEWHNDPESWLVPLEMPDQHLKKPDHFVGHWYKLADTRAEDPDVQAAWAQMLLTWEKQDSDHHDQLRQLWKQMNDWFYDGYRQTATRLGISFDPKYVSYESEIYEAGKNIILEATDKGIFQKLPDGAVKVELEAYGLPDKILLRKDGTGIYMTFDIELTRQRSAHKANKLIWVVGVDQQLYFQQLFAVSELLGYGKREDFYHFAYGMVRLPEGKMSSRKGIVVYADDLLDAAKEKATQVMAETNIAKTFTQDERDKVVESVGVGAVKWTMLSQDPVSEITFDVNESVSFKGFAGPYIQYTVARCYSVLEKAKNSTTNEPIDVLINSTMLYSEPTATEEVDLLRNLIKYFDAVERAAENYSPHVLAVYLFELSQAFNTFYANCPILTENAEEKDQVARRLVLTAATIAVLKRGLELLGISPITKM